MVAGLLRCLTCFFTCAVLLLGVCLRGVEAFSCQHVIHKQVGGTVELSSCSPAEGVAMATWRYGGAIVADKDRNISGKQFEGRLDLNPTNFSLTVRRLTLRDSGEFMFVSVVNDSQRPTVTVTLQVHEPIADQPVLTSSSSWNTATNSCTVLLECSATSDSNATYKWTVRKQTLNDSRLQYNIREQDGDTTFTCTVYNSVSEKSTSTTVTCSNETQGASTQGSAFAGLLSWSVAGGGCLMIVVAVGVAVCVCQSNRRRAAGSDWSDLSVYAAVAEAAAEDPCSVYQNIDNRVNPVTPKPQTVYDKIQFGRMRTDSVSRCQDVFLEGHSDEHVSLQS